MLFLWQISHTQLGSQATRATPEASVPFTASASALASAMGETSPLVVAMMGCVWSDANDFMMILELHLQLVSWFVVPSWLEMMMLNTVWIVLEWLCLMTFVLFHHVHFNATCCGIFNRCFFIICRVFRSAQAASLSPRRIKYPTSTPPTPPPTPLKVFPYVFLAAWILSFFFVNAFLNLLSVNNVNLTIKALWLLTQSEEIRLLFDIENSHWEPWLLALAIRD